MTELTVAPPTDLSPRTLEEAMKFADLLAKSTIVPKDFMNNAGNIFVAIQWGAELGLKPMQAMQNIAVINGRPSLWGDAVIALVRSSPLCEYIYETIDSNGTAICRVKRRNEDEQVRTFSDADATKAGLLNKSGPWAQYPSRMKQMRARAFALRDVFSDVLKGMPVAEEVMDFEEKEINPTQKSEPARKEIESYPTQAFLENFPKWEKLIVSGKKTADDIINMVSSKAKLSEDQANSIRAIPAPIQGEAEVIA